MKKFLNMPFDRDEIAALRMGDFVCLSGSFFTARDAAHKRLFQLLDEGQPLPINIVNQAIYYVGPCPAIGAQAIGSCGPTTSGRMDTYAPRLLDLGLSAMIGKGQRNPAVISAIVRNKAVYLAATGGAGAFLSQFVKKADVLCFPELGTEAIHRFDVENFPCVVAIDSIGQDIYKMGPALFRK